MYQITTKKSMAAIVAIAAIAAICLPVTSLADVDIDPGLDVWKTNPCDGAVDLPALPAGFFGPGSLAVEACPDFELKGHPFPDICDPPNPFPKNEYRLQITWRDQHGNTVSADSRHKVSKTVRRVIPRPPYNFDTIVSRGTKGGSVPDPPLTFQNVDDEQLGNITFCWLSLKGCEKKEVKFEGGSTKLFEVFICLSDTPQISGRMKFIAKDVRDGGGGGIVDLGDSTDPAATAFEAGNFNFFQEDPAALGLPLFYKVVFRDCDDPNNIIEIDDPDGTKTGFRTTVLWNHDPPPGSEKGDGDWEVREEGRLCVPEGLDCWTTPPGDATVELPPLGQGFFGFNPTGPSNLSDPITGRVLEFEGWPSDIPCGRPRPENLPGDKLETIVVWRDIFGNIVGADSFFKVTSSVEVIPKPTVGRLYDTVVRRGGACFDTVGETHDVPIEIVELSLRSVDPIEVSFDQGPNRFFDVFVCLSDRFEESQRGFLNSHGRPFVGRRGLAGRMRMTASKVGEAGGEVELDINGPDPVGFDTVFGNSLLDPTGFDQDFGFLENPDALGLPVAYQILFFELEPGTETGTRDLIDKDPATPKFDPANGLDSWDNLFGITTTSLFHNQLGGHLKIFQQQPGDMNGDGTVDRFDIDPFVLAREDPNSYRNLFNKDPGILRDCNGDGVADDADIDCFLQTILGDRTIVDFWEQRDTNVFGDQPGAFPVPSGAQALRDVIERDFRILNLGLENGDLLLNWGSIPGRPYGVEFSTDLKLWQQLVEPFIAVDRTTERSFSIPATGNGFVRPVENPNTVSLEVE